MNKEPEMTCRNHFHSSERHRDAVWKVLVARKVSA